MDLDAPGYIRFRQRKAERFGPRFFERFGQYSPEAEEWFGKIGEEVAAEFHGPRLRRASLDRDEQER
jgi:hypothetical protein